MKILQINKLYHPWIGGVEQHVKDLSEGLVINGHDVSVLAISENSKKQLTPINNVQVTKVPNHIYKFFKKVLLFSMPINIFFPFYLRKLSKNRILHFHLPNPLAEISYLLFKPKGKVVVMWHSDIVKQKIFLKFYKPFLYMFLKKADIILTTSPNMINNSTFLQAFKHKCKVLHLGIDPTEYILTKTEQKNVDSFKQNTQTKEILFVGRLTYYKGVSILIEAMKNTDAHLTIIGDGYLKEECLTLIDKNQLKNKITILPPQTKRELIKWFHKCDIFILPSIAPSEAFGIVQLEAMICKKPVISTNLPTGVPYVNQNGYSGIIVPVGDILALNKAIKELLANVKMMTTYGENGHKRVLSEFTNQKMIENIIKIYSEL